MMRFVKSESKHSKLTLVTNMDSVIALSKLFSLNDPRLAQTMVNGDRIMSASDRIVTRSQTKQSKLAIFSMHYHSLTPVDPEQFTIIPVPLKIIKLLIEELL